MLTKRHLKGLCQKQVSQMKGARDGRNGSTITWKEGGSKGTLWGGAPGR